MHDDTLEIRFHDLEHSTALEERIRAKHSKLVRMFPRIVRCHVTVEKIDRHSTPRPHHRVRFDVKIPGNEIVTNAETGEGRNDDVYLALRDAFDKVTRRLQDEKRDRAEAPRPGAG